MKKALIVLAGMVLVVLAYSSFFLFRKPAEKYTYITDAFETDTKLLITKDDEVIYSLSDAQRFSIYTSRKRRLNFEQEKDTFKPFFFKGNVAALQDEDGDENFKSTSQDLNSYFPYTSFKSIWSFENGFLLAVQLSNDNDLYLLDLKANSKRVLLKSIEKIHDISYIPASKIFVVNCDDQLLKLTVDDAIGIKVLATNNSGYSMNLFVNQDYVYFSNNNDSDYFQIYRLPLGEEYKSPELLHKGDHDMRMPKFFRENLYYIEIVNSQYLLRKLTKNGAIIPLTTQGVVYDYSFNSMGNIILSYSDFSTPKSILQINAEGIPTNLTGKTHKTSLSFKFIETDEGRSPSFIFYPPNKQNVKGVILNFHPGLTSDFSPRWDAILMNLCSNGYLIVSPNYPMSSGYGKAYNQSDMPTAVKDILTWKSFLKLQYPHIPLYYLSSSSGNILMENSLAADAKGITAAVSLFGILLKDPKDTNVPTLFILGENDPVVNFRTTMSTLMNAKDANPKIDVISYENEGHWLRKELNAKRTIEKILSFFNTNL